jgi:hypothetical protein
LNGLVEQSGIDHRIDGARDNLDPGLKQWPITEVFSVNLDSRKSPYGSEGCRYFSTGKKFTDEPPSFRTGK